MATLTPIFEQIEASITTKLADLKNNLEKATNLLADLEAAGIEFKVKEPCCRLSAHANGDVTVSFSIHLNNAPSEITLGLICKQHGRGWYVDRADRAALIYVDNIIFHFWGFAA
ncbi:hypothetical protein [Chromobacterium rhizoryzae]|uniref:hypothetical protein n=1 Tax=Chromobacterium rhizoryzae TaxID=1778675 RepID=UPI001D092A67|nr:hypothetical protein [Chromobacterium rhizoryzae]